MTLTDTVPVLRPSVRGTEELAAIGRSVTGGECLKRSHAPEPLICVAAGAQRSCLRHTQTWSICASNAVARDRIGEVLIPRHGPILV